MRAALPEYQNVRPSVRIAPGSEVEVPRHSQSKGRTFRFAARRHNLYAVQVRPNVHLFKQRLANDIFVLSRQPPEQGKPPVCPFLVFYPLRLDSPPQPVGRHSISRSAGFVRKRIFSRAAASLPSILRAIGLHLSIKNP
jgi:hypothetical protein